MADLKTKPTNQDPLDFLDSIESETKRNDALELYRLLGKTTGMSGTMWGSSIIGYGSYRYKYKSGHSGEYFLTGFSPRKQNLTVYIMPGFSSFSSQLNRLGKHKTARSCLYINRLSDIDIETLQEIISESVAIMKSIYSDYSAE